MVMVTFVTVTLKVLLSSSGRTALSNSSTLELKSWSHTQRVLIAMTGGLHTYAGSLTTATGCPPASITATVKSLRLHSNWPSALRLPGNRTLPHLPHLCAPFQSRKPSTSVAVSSGPSVK
eukprot:3932487-Rhodomonas_salina.1